MIRIHFGLRGRIPIWIWIRIWSISDWNPAHITLSFLFSLETGDILYALIQQYQVGLTEDDYLCVCVRAGYLLEVEFKSQIE